MLSSLQQIVQRVLCVCYHHRARGAAYSGILQPLNTSLKDGWDGNKVLNGQDLLIISTVCLSRAHEMNNSLGWQSGGGWWLVALWGPVAGRAVVAVPVVAPGVLRGILLELLPRHDPLYLLFCDLKHKQKLFVGGGGHATKGAVSQFNWLGLATIAFH